MNTKSAATVIKLVFLLVTPAALWGCEQGTSPPGTTDGPGRGLAEGKAPRAASEIHPCSLVTTEEVIAAFFGGSAVTMPAPDRTTCAYTVTMGAGALNSPRVGSLVVSVTSADSPRFQLFDSTADERTQAQPIAGLGDRALLLMSRDRPDDGPKAIRVLKGDVYFTIAMSTSGEPVSTELLKALADKALSRLP